jgi:hypothetical protein
VWKRVWTAAALVALLAGAAGCARSGSAPSAGPTTSVMQAGTLGIALARCASMTAADIAAATGLTGLQPVAGEPLRCSWELPGANDYAVVFQWFRGSALADRSTQVTLGKPDTVRVSGHSGIEWSGPQGCEIAVDSGGGDFIDWVVTSAVARPPVCAALPRLAAATFTKAG